MAALHQMDMSEAEAMAAIRINAAVIKALQEDGLGSWMAPPVWSLP
jgi:hypothetical protein